MILKTVSPTTTLSKRRKKSVQNLNFCPSYRFPLKNTTFRKYVKFVLGLIQNESQEIKS